MLQTILTLKNHRKAANKQSCFSYCTSLVFIFYGEKQVKQFYWTKLTAREPGNFLENDSVYSCVWGLAINGRPLEKGWTFCKRPIFTHFYDLMAWIDWVFKRSFIKHFLRQITHLVEQFLSPVFLRKYCLLMTLLPNFLVNFLRIFLIRSI